MSHPTLVAFVDGIERARLVPPAALDERAWLLAVAAVQLTGGDGGVRSVLRAHVTGAAAPQVIELDASARVDLVLVGANRSMPPLPELAAAAPSDVAASLAIAVNGTPGRRAVLTPALRGADPPPRAFGHVYSRWLRDGRHESGYDLTDFQSAPRGVKYARIQSAAATPPLVVSYLISAI